jgi:excisionase family DNA binding protein
MEGSCTTPTEPPPLAVSKREAARLLGISVRTVDHYIALKVIQCVRLGKRVLIPMKALNALLSRGAPALRRGPAEKWETTNTG